MAPPTSRRRLGIGRALAVAGLVAWAAFGTVSVAGAQEDTGTTEEADVSHAAHECIEKLEKGGAIDDCQEAPSPIIPEVSEIVWGTISFFALLLLMYKFAWPGLQKGMQGRADKIRADLDDAARLKAEAEEALAQYKRQIGDARAEANGIIEEARQTADQLRRDMAARAEAEVAEQRQRAREEIVAAQDRASAELEARVGGIAIDLAEKVVQANLDHEANMRLIEGFIRTVGNGSSS